MAPSPRALALPSWVRISWRLWAPLFGLALACSCQREGSKPNRKPGNMRSLAPSASVATLPRASIEAPVASAIVEIRERLSLAAPGPRLRRVAFGRGFVAQLTPEAVIVRGTSDGKRLYRTSVSGPLALLALPGGSVLVATSSASYRLDPGERFLHPRTRLSLLPGSFLEPSRESSEFVWVIEPSRTTALRYALSPDAGIGLIAEQSFPRFDQGALATLRDGSFLYTAGSELAHAEPRSKPVFARRPPELESPWRLLAADRIDHAWAVTARGDVSLLEIRGRVRVVRTLRTGRLPIDFAATPTRFALLSVLETPKAPRQFVLSVYGNDGRELFSRPVGSAAPSSDANWTASALRDQQLSLGTDPDQVAIGGPGALRLFDSSSGVEQVLTD